MKVETSEHETAVKFFKWDSNPFNFRVLPNLFVGYMKEVSDLSYSIENGDKFSMLLGPTGSGKTTLMKYLSTKFHANGNIIYISKPPKKPEDWIDIFMNFTGIGFLNRIRRRILPR